MSACTEYKENCGLNGDDLCDKCYEHSLAVWIKEQLIDSIKGKLTKKQERKLSNIKPENRRFDDWKLDTFWTQELENELPQITDNTIRSLYSMYVKDIKNGNYPNGDQTYVENLRSRKR